MKKKILDLEEQLARAGSLEKEIERYRRELEDEKVEIKEMETDLNRACKYYDKKNETLENLEREVEKYRKVLADDKMEIAELEMDLNKAREHYDKKIKILEKLQREKETLKKM